MIRISNLKFNILTFLLFGILFTIIVFRAFNLSITYDEVWTFDLASQSVLDIATAERNFTSANNHILNSILIKPFLVAFGHDIWVLRLPNVLASLLYLSTIFLLIK